MPFSIRHKLPLAYISCFWFLITLLLLSSKPAYAEWVRYSENKETGMTVYVDLDAIRRKGDLVKMWQLFDFKTKQTAAGDSFLSSKIQSEYDCTEERSRRIAYTDFSGNMGRGKVVDNDSYKGEWQPVAPESMAQALWKLACRKQ
jgi:hypothetical protein